MHGDPAMGMAGAPFQIGYQDPSMRRLDPSQMYNAGMNGGMAPMRPGHARDAAAKCRRRARAARARCPNTDAPSLSPPLPLAQGARRPCWRVAFSTSESASRAAPPQARVPRHLALTRHVQLASAVGHG